MTADALLTRLDGVRSTGHGCWMARCSAHADRSPSLSIREKDDGCVLLRCHAGCDPRDVLVAVGLDFSDLYPERAVDHRVRRERSPFPARDVLLALADEALLVATAAGYVFAGNTLTPDDLARLNRAAVRINDAAALFKPHPEDGHRDVLSRDELDEVAA